MAIRQAADHWFQTKTITDDYRNREITSLIRLLQARPQRLGPTPNSILNTMKLKFSLTALAATVLTANAATTTWGGATTTDVDNWTTSDTPFDDTVQSTPFSPPSGPAQRLLQGPPAKSKFLAVSRLLSGRPEKH